MSGLMVQYSKELAKELTKIAVVLPGAPVQVGDILHFPNGKAGFWPFVKPAPRGAFNIVSSLEDLGIDFDPPESDTHPDPYTFSSSGGVSTNFSLDADATTGTPVGASGELTARFSKAGATYFTAAGCTTQTLKNVQGLELGLAEHRANIDWGETFIVTSVTVARRALIMQSSSSSGEMKVAGQVQGLMTGSGADIGADAELAVSGYKDAAFIKPWSENVTVFMSLYRYNKRFSGAMQNSRLNEANKINNLHGDRMRDLTSRLVHTPEDKFSLDAVDVSEVLQADATEFEGLFEGK